jgi:tRNA(Ile)-lysidine synthase
MVPPYAYTLTVDEEVLVAEARLGISASATTGASDAVDGAYVRTVPSTVFPLTIRNRRPGDRVAMSSGTRKVQDLMVDAKIPRSERANVPLVVAADGQILWVIGLPGRNVPVAGTGVVNMVTLKVRRLETT